MPNATDTLSNMGRTIQVSIRSHDEANQALLYFAFGQIQNPDDWKAPIDCIVPMESASLVYYAIVHFTGMAPTSTRLSDGRFHMTCVGYRMGDCGP